MSYSKSEPLIHAQSATVLYVEPAPGTHSNSSQSSSRRLFGLGSCCCLFSLTLFLLLFFLVPRVPRTIYMGTTVYFNPYTVVQNYEVYNENLYR